MRLKTGTEYIPQQHSAPEYIKYHVTTAIYSTLISSVACHLMNYLFMIYFLWNNLFGAIFSAIQFTIVQDFSSCRIFFPKKFKFESEFCKATPSGQNSKFKLCCRFHKVWNATSLQYFCNNLLVNSLKRL